MHEQLRREIEAAQRLSMIGFVLGVIGLAAGVASIIINLLR
jgi:hypothetical protein